MPKKVDKSEEDWRRELSEEQYAICRERGTEPAFTGKYWDCKDPGVYRCSACGLELFRSEEKYDSGTGWPSFTAPIDGENVQTEADHGHGMVRTEVLCAACDAHLGHVFPDGPGSGSGSGGQRYCMNSLSLELQRDEGNEGDEE